MRLGRLTAMLAYSATAVDEAIRSDGGIRVSSSGAMATPSSATLWLTGVAPPLSPAIPKVIERRGSREHRNSLPASSTTSGHRYLCGYISLFWFGSSWVCQAGYAVTAFAAQVLTSRVSLTFTRRTVIS